MPTVARGKPRNLQVVVQEGLRPGERVAMTGEELFLMVIARRPIENTSDAQVFALHLSHHHRRIDALRWRYVMRATGGMNMVIARVPAEFCRMNPPFEVKGEWSRVSAAKVKLS